MNKTSAVMFLLTSFLKTHRLQADEEIKRTMRVWLCLQAEGKGGKGRAGPELQSDLWELF